MVDAYSIKKNGLSLTKEKYNRILCAIKSAKAKGSVTKTAEEYNFLRRYAVAVINNEPRLVKFEEKEVPPENLQYFAHNDELFEIIFNAHVNCTGHGGINRTNDSIKRRYANIPREVVKLFISLCETCQKKASVPKKGLVVKPIMSKEFNSRCQVDLIDMQSCADGNYRFIMVYQDHLTKFVQLRALRSKEAVEVADAVSSIFAIFGAPSIFHTDNGREFANKVIGELCAKWPATKIVHGKPRHSQSQGSVERANQDVEKMLASCLSENNSSEWTQFLDKIQFMKNRAIHTGNTQLNYTIYTNSNIIFLFNLSFCLGIGCSPYEALFGVPPKMGIEEFPLELLADVETEEDTNFVGTVTIVETGSSAAITEENIVYPNVDLEQPMILEEDEPFVEIASPADSDNIIVSIDDGLAAVSLHNDSPCDQMPDQGQNEVADKIAKISSIRSRARSRLNQQAHRMTKRSAQLFPPAQIGQSVRIPVPDVDRAKADFGNILGVILEVIDNCFYKIGTKWGKLNSLYARNQFSVCPEIFLSVDEVPSVSLSLREVATKSSVVGGQGFLKCNCISKCTSRRCSCLRGGLKCNSKCHSSMPCCNK